jgi:hypothetical protein
MKPFSRLAAVVCASLVTASGCRAPLDTSREEVDTGTFGQTVVNLVCKRVAYLEDLADGGVVDVRGDTYRDACRLGLAPPADAPAPLQALLARWEDLSEATDTMFPADFLDRLQAFLTSNEFLALYDDQDAMRAVDALIGVLRLLADDADAIAALERLNVRPGYRPKEPALGAVRAAVRYPGLDPLLLALAQAVTPGGGARDEWLNLVEAVGAALRNAAPTDAPADPERTGRLARDLLLGERALLGTSKTIPLARRDGRGLAVPASVGAPFVDADADGLADVDAVGRFVDAAGAPLAVPAPFQLPEGAVEAPWADRDADGRPLTAPGGALVYQYVDVDKTVLTALARDAGQLFDPSRGTAFDLLRGASALLGPRVAATRAYDNGEQLEYRGWDLADSPLLDMLYGYLQILRDPGTADTLALVRTLLTSYEPETARLIEAVVAAARMGDAHPEAAIAVDAPLWDDLVPLVRQVLANPSLVNALLRALERPEVEQLGERFRKYMTYKDRFDINASQQVVGAFTTPVDRAADDDNFNRSLFQRLLHLISDSNGARLCNKPNAQVGLAGIPLATYAECDLVQIDNVATFYIQSIAYAKDSAGRYLCENDAGEFGSTTTATTPEGCVAQGNGRRPRPKADMNFSWGFIGAAISVFGGDGFVEDQSTITGFRTHPTPQALNRVLFLQPTPDLISDTLDPPRDKDGDRYIDQHVGTLPVWELEGFYDQVRPVLQAFADHNAEQLFVDLLSVIHKHWPSADSINHQSFSPTAPNYAWGSGGESYEPLVAAVLADGEVLGALVDGAPRLNAITVNGRSFATVLRGAGTYLLTPRADLADRRGQTTSTTADGRPVTTLSPWQVLADAYARRRARLEAAAGEGVAWTDSVAEVVDVLARGLDVPGQGWRFRNPRLRGVAVALVDFLAARVASHDASGDRVPWLSTDLPARIEDALTSPVVAGAADFILSLQSTPETRAQLESLVQYLVDEIDHDDAFRAAITAVADLLQLSVSDADIVPLARVAGEALAPDRTWLDDQLWFVRRARESDADRALATLLVNLFEETRPGRTAIGDLVDGIGEVQRANPYADLGARFTAADFRALFTGLADFLDEEKRGLRKFIRIIEDRSL